MKSQTPLVSVIMAEYNTNIDLLKESIESILNQSYDNFEFIIIDDCGENNVEKIVNKYNDSRIKVYKNPENKGLVYSLNVALSKSKGKYIARMDTDDYSYKNRLKLEVEYLEEHSNIDLIGGRADFYDGDKIWGESKFSGIITKKIMLSSSPIIHPSVMFKKSTMDKIGGYLNYKRCEDYATWIEFFVNGYKMEVIPEKLIRYHLSINDYKKRTIKTRKGFFLMLKEEYKKLKPTKFQYFKIYIKSYIAGLMPWRLMYIYHKRKAR